MEDIDATKKKEKKMMNLGPMNPGPERSFYGIRTVSDRLKRLAAETAFRFPMRDDESPFYEWSENNWTDLKDAVEGCVVEYLTVFQKPIPHRKIVASRAICSIEFLNTLIAADWKHGVQQDTREFYVLYFTGSETFLFSLLQLLKLCSRLPVDASSEAFGRLVFVLFDLILQHGPESVKCVLVDLVLREERPLFQVFRLNIAFPKSSKDRESKTAYKGKAKLRRHGVRSSLLREVAFFAAVCPVAIPRLLHTIQSVTVATCRHHLTFVTSLLGYIHFYLAYPSEIKALQQFQTEDAFESGAPMDLSPTSFYVSCITIGAWILFLFRGLFCGVSRPVTKAQVTDGSVRPLVAAASYPTDRIETSVKKSNDTGTRSVMQFIQSTWEHDEAKCHWNRNPEQKMRRDRFLSCFPLAVHFFDVMVPLFSSFQKWEDDRHLKFLEDTEPEPPFSPDVQMWTLLSELFRLTGHR